MYGFGVLCSRAGNCCVGKTALAYRAFADESGIKFLHLVVDPGKRERTVIANFLWANAERLRLFQAHAGITTVKALLAALYAKAAADRCPRVLFVDGAQYPEVPVLLLLSVSGVGRFRALTDDDLEVWKADAVIKLQPFTTRELKALLDDKSEGRAASHDHLALWMLTGGVPRYVHCLLDAGCLMRDAMIHFVASSRSDDFLLLGQRCLWSALTSERTTYFEFMSAVAAGVTLRSDIASVFPERDISAHLRRLETHYGWLKRVVPFGKARTVRDRGFQYVVPEPFLCFWFRFFHAYAFLLEQPNGRDETD